MGVDAYSNALRSQSSDSEKELAALAAQINEQERVLSELRSSISPIEAEPSAESTTYLQQVRRLTATYQTLANSKPYLPSRDSLLPGLLAFRVISKTISETQNAISQSHSLLQETSALIQREKADLCDAKMIKFELSERIKSLEEDLKKQQQETPESLVQREIRELENKKINYDIETSNLATAFYSFNEKYLGPMLAVEELGGPIVGQMTAIDDEILEGSFSYRGKAKKGKLHEDKRQKRISQIWGVRPLENEKIDEKSVAAAEMRELTERLLDKLDDADGASSSSYIKIQRESAAARFLVRSKVAQFHPKDSSRLRLIGFGGEVGD